MDSEVVIKVDNLSKKFCRSIKRSMLYGSMDVARSMLGLSTDRARLRKHEFWSLKDISFEIKRGETFGLVGANGSGKSTLLRMINGIFPPDVGSISVKGRIGALIAVGAGFHPHMTGRENIFLNGTVLGMTKEEIADKMDDIIEFAEIGEFLDAPVSTYSSGMYVRLGFAIAIHSNPDIVLVDEILAVGDAKFQRKCLDKIREMRNKGTTFILVSHNMQNIEAICDRAVLIDRGCQLMIGTPQEIIPVYELLLQTGELNTGVEEKTEIQDGELVQVHKYEGFGTEEIDVCHVRIIDKSGKKLWDFNSGEEITFEAELNSSLDVHEGVIDFSINYVNKRGKVDEDLTAIGIQTRYSLSKGKSTLRIDLGKLRLTTGEYNISFNLFDDAYSNPYTQGHYGYFRVKNGIPTMLRVGQGTPLLWLDTPIIVEKDEL